MKKVSVIMGVYNVTEDKEIVRDAINSILNQTYKNFEFVICDDGSNDHTYEMVSELIAGDQRCILIKNDMNRGLPFTLNHCLNHCEGEYIARMDADDFSESERLEEEKIFLDKNNRYSLVGTNANLHNSDGVYGVRRTIEYPKKENFLFQNPFVHGSIMIRRSVLDDLGGYRVSKDTIRGQDYDLWMKLYSNGYIGYNIQKSLYSFKEDNAARSRRKYKYRVSEAKIRYRGFKSLKLFPRGYIYILKPLVVGLIPQKLLALLRGEKC